MKNEKKIKSIIIIINLITILNLFNSVYAFGINDLTGTTSETSEISRTFGKIIGIFTAIGSVVSILALIMIGIKYMLGSVEEKAEYKKTMMPYVIGAILVFAASTIAQIVYVFASNIK